MTSQKHSGSGDCDKDNDKAILSIKPNGKFNTVGLLPILLDLKESASPLAKPSIFNNEMQMSAEDRIYKLVHTREKATLKVPTVPKTESLKFFPRVVVFQNFHPGKVYKVPVSVRNACQVMKPLQITYEESQYFSVSFTSGLYTRIAPGMSTVLMVHFSPEDKKDDSYTIALQCNKECFNIPIIAIGPRPILDFPDDIYIPSGPIKIRCTKVVLVRNIGDVPAIFSLMTSSPFDVEPRKGVLRPSEMMNVRVFVTPRTSGNIQGILKISYESGEELHSQIHGLGEEANVWMDKSSITVEESYIGVKEMTTVTVHNDSDYILNFKWKKMASIEEECIEYDRLTKGFSFLKDLESKKYSKLSKGDIVDEDTHNQVYNRMYDDEVRALRNEEFLFNHSLFILRPLTGDIWPKSSIDIMVIFEPDKSGTHTTVAYLDIPGHEERLPLALNGFVKGPQFAFNLDVLDIDCVFVYNTHYYEIVVKNIGLIPGTIEYKPSETNYGGKISCTPDSIGLMPEECKTFLVSFSSNVQGEFFENVLFKSQESDEVFKVELKGSVVTPTFTFNLTSLDFGIVPFSFPISHSILLQNLSMVPVNYKLTVKGDGSEPSISYKKYAELKDKPRFSKNPKEFFISPTEGTVSAYSSTKVKVTLTANIIREKKTTLAVEMLDAVSEPVCLAMTHTAAFPNLVCSPSDINIRFCFINYPYTRAIVLENKSNVMGFFHILPQSLSATNTLSCSSNINDGIISAGSKIKVPLSILTNALGMQTLSVSMLTLGDDAPREICTISGCGQGPVVTVEPHLLDYGNVELLRHVTEEFILTNDSPVSAKFSTALSKKQSPWEIFPQSGILEAENNITVQVTIYLRDTGKYKDSVQIEISGSRTLQVALTAEGVGTSLVIDPEFCPVYDLGSVLTTQDIERKFTITNEGNKNHQIYWSHLSHLNDFHNKKEISDLIVKPVFQFEPNSMNLTARETCCFSIRGICKKAQRVSEQFFCHGIVGNKKEILLSAVVKANFIDPKVIFSKRELNFKINIGFNDKYKILHETVNMQNITDLSYEIELKTEYPFQIMGVKELVSTIPALLNRSATIKLTLTFDSSCVTDLYSRKFQSFLHVKYRNHPHLDYLPLHGEVCFPNMKILPNVVDFGCVPIGCESSTMFEIINEGGLPITYHWYKEEEFQEKSDGIESGCSSQSEDFDKSTEVKSSESELSLPKEDSYVKQSSDIEEISYSAVKKGGCKVTDNDIKAVLFPIISQFIEEESDDIVLQSLPCVEQEKFGFDITPHFGQLGPHESQIVSAAFGGDQLSNQRALFVCDILGGPTQVIKMKGQICELKYTLDKTLIDIGHQIFCVPCSRALMLTNTGRLSFEFSINLKSGSTDDFASNGQTRNIRVEPLSGCLQAKQIQEIQVSFYPGSINKFHETFSIQIGYLEPITITLTGYGVIPQLYAFLPRPKSFMVNVDIGFESIDSLLSEQLLIENKDTNQKKKLENTSDLSLFGRNISKRDMNELKTVGWTVITYDDQYPTVAEIDLAVERLLAQEFVKQCSFTFLKNLPKCHSLPGLTVPSYDIDLGTVMVGTSISYSALLYNYGPIFVSGTFHFSLQRDVLAEMGFSFKMPTISKLHVDQTVAMQIFFNPTREIYHEKQHNIEYIIFLEVFSGASVPINVRAVVTRPYLVASAQKLDFETIKCGERKIMTFIIRNEGLIPCRWHGEIKGKGNKRPFKKSQQDQKTICPYSFSFLENKSILQPQQKVDVEVMFYHPIPGFKENNLFITIDKSAEVLSIPLFGTVVEPQLIFAEQSMEFEPTLPYPDNYVKQFKIINSSNYPIEFYLPHLDSQLVEEERLLRVLCDYYQTDKLNLPLRAAGEPLPKELYLFYNNLVASLRTQEEEVLSQAERRKRRRRSRAEKSRVLSAGPALPARSSSQGTVASLASASASDFFTPQDPGRLEDLLREHMNELRQKFKSLPNNDPVKAANDAVLQSPPSRETCPDEGLLLIFFGAPYSNSVYLAHKTAKYLDLKLLNVDDVLLQAAATSTSPEAIKLRDKINSIYSERAPSDLSYRGPEGVKEEMQEGDSEEDENEGSYGSDPVDEMAKKVKCVLASPKKVESMHLNRIQSKRFDSMSARASFTQPTSQQSIRRGTIRKTSLPDETGVTIPGISVELLEEILKGRFALPDCQQGIVIDHLKSIFFETPGITFSVLLRAAGFIKYVHLLLFHNTFEKYASLYTSEKLAAEEQARIENEKKLALFDTLTTEDIEGFSESDKALYEDVMISKRKEEWQNKKNEELKQKQKSVKGKSVKGNKRGISDVVKKHSKQIQSNASDSVSPVSEMDKKNRRHSALSTEDRKKTRSKSAGSLKIVKISSFVPSDNDLTVIDNLAAAEALFNTFESEYNEILTIALSWDKRKSSLNLNSTNRIPQQSSTKTKLTRKSPSIVIQLHSRAKLSELESSTGGSKITESVHETFEEESILTWIFDCSKPDPYKDELITELLTDSEEFNISRPDASLSLKPHPVLLNCVVQCPKKREKVKTSEEFSFCNYEQDAIPEDVSDVASDVPEKVGTGSILQKPRVSRKKSSKTRKSDIADIKSEPIAVEGPKLKTRWILNSGEAMELTIKFDPHSVGEYIFKFPLEIAGCNRKKYFTVQGLCDLPRIDMDPYVLFDHAVKSKDHEKLYRLTFFLDKNNFDFGAILITKQKDKRLHHIATSFNISNCSTLPAEVRFSFLDKAFEKVDAFAIEPTLLVIQPHRSDKVTVFATPRNLGHISETILLSVKDNPSLERIKISCTGVKVDFEVEPKTLVFDHVLVFRKAFRMLKLKNRSLVPVIWHFVGFDDSFLEQFDISSTEGLIMPLDEQDIRIEYFATQVVHNTKKHIKIEVFDEEGRGDPVCVETINIIAESVDVVVDISFDDPKKNYIDFGRTKVGNHYSKKLYLRNRGKHDVVYKLELDIPSNVTIPNLHKMLSVVPETGVLLYGEKATALDVTCHPRIEIHLYAMPVFKCYLLDGHTVVATIPIQVSILAQQCRYEIQPKPDLNFGPLPLGSKRTLPVTIKNTGVWEITYSVFKDHPRKFTEEETTIANESMTAESIRTERRIDKEDLRSSVARTKKSFRHDTVVSIGIFTMSPSYGTVNAGEITTIQVECDMEYEGTFSEIMNINIPEKSPNDTSIDAIELLAVGCIPYIDFTDFGNLFEEAFICEKLEEIKCPHDIRSHSVFVKEENKLLFSQTCLGLSSMVRIKLKNPGLVPCDITASILRQTPSGHSKPTKATEIPFSVSPSKLCILPYNTDYLEVSFTPNQIGVYTCHLEITVETPSPQKDHKLLVKLVGEGCVPIVCLVEPKQFAGSEETDVLFPPTLLGKKNVQKVELQNTGSISCHMMLEMNDSCDDTFSVIPTEETVSLIVHEHLEGPGIRASLAPAAKASFEVAFSPRDLGKFTGNVKIYTVGNPYEKISVNLIGECYTEDITMDLPSVLITEARDKDDDAEEADTICQYTLDFKYCFVNGKKDISFKINNHSLKNIYRFEFATEKFVNFSPSVGHLKPNSSKEITASLEPSESVDAGEVIVECNLEKIIYPEGSNVGTSWDDRLTAVRWKERAVGEDKYNPRKFELLETEKLDALKRKAVEKEPEPDYLPVPDSALAVPLQVLAVVGHARYECDASPAHEFPDTLMHQSSAYHFTILNTGKIPLEFHWNVHADNARLSTEPAYQVETVLAVDAAPDPALSESESAASQPVGPPNRGAQPSASDIKENNEDLEEGQDGTSAVDALSSASSKSQRSQESTADANHLAFAVEPSYGTVEPGNDVNCKLTFTPLDIFEHRVVIFAVMPYLDPELEPLKLFAKGRSIMPLCHFEMEECDYITSGRRDLSLPGPLGLNPGIPLDAETRVIEFKIVGIGDSHTKKLCAMNPTEMSYSYFWEDLTVPGSDSVSMFYCTPQRGNIDGNKEVEMTCTFIAHDTGTFESFWNFVIPECDKKYPFLFVGKIRQPSVCFLSAHVALCPTVVGLSAVKYTSLINNEQIPLKFHFDRNSVFSEGQEECLEIKPLKGKVFPNEECLVMIQITPKQPGISHFDLRCHIQGMKEPLLLTVTGECFPVQPLISYEHEKGQITNLSPIETNVIDFGEVSVKCSQSITFRITNVGKATFYYYWQYDEKILKQKKIKLSFQNRGGHVTSQSRAVTSMKWMFFDKSHVTDLFITLQVNKGPDYKILLKGKSTRANYEFSSLEYNFGQSLYKEGIQYKYQGKLYIKNNDSDTILIECLFKNTPHLTLENANGPISPGEDKEITLVFCPQGIIKYEEEIEFIMNGCSKQLFKIIGEGVDYQVGLQNPRNKLVLFSPVLPGGSGFACIPIINHSKNDVNVEFLCGREMLERHMSLFTEEGISTILNSVCDRVEGSKSTYFNPFEISSKTMVTLKPQQVVNLCVRFNPVKRTKLFSEKVYLKMLNHIEPLSILQGSCVGPEFSFDRNAVPFGGVLKGCSSTQKFKLINSGEVGAKFIWEPDEWCKMFSIVPTMGYSSPDTETTFTITFAPKEFQKTIRYLATCSILDFSPLKLNITGSCWEQPTPKETISFHAPVRSQDKKLIPLINKTGVSWNITPQLTGQYFYGPEIVSVPPYGTIQYEVTYTPLVMTEDRQHHIGTVLFCLPEGRALSYKLSGTAETPVSSGKIMKEIPCKETYTEILSVSNWLGTSQRFIITNEVTKSEKIDPIYILSGNEYIDVPGATDREYKWTIYCYKECTLNIKVLFRNVLSKEYLFYDLVLKVVKRGPIEMVNLTTPVRQPLTHDINLINPLSVEVNYSITCSSPEINFKSPIPVPSHTQHVSAEIEYIPISPGESTVQLDIHCTELGTFPYELILKALPPVPEKLIKCTTPVGTTTTMEAVVENMTKGKADFSLKVDNKDFETEKQVVVASHHKGNVSITFEPTSVGNINATLIAASPTAGEIQFPLLGVATEPRPQGPFVVKLGGNTILTFKNIFNEKQTFSVTLDTRQFSVKNSLETIRPKKEARIIVTFVKTSGVSTPLPEPATGKLVIFSTSPALSGIKWVYYLKGVD